MNKRTFAALVAGVFIICGYGLFMLTRVNNTGVYILQVNSGMTGRSIAAQLRNDGVVRSTFLMRSALALSGKSHAIQAGKYILDTTQAHTVFDLSEQLLGSSPAHEAVMITITEGSRGRDILTELQKVMSPEKLEGITPQDFDKHIGYLFPNTYAIDDTTTVRDIIEKMQAEYEENISPLRNKFAAVNLTEQEVIILASILEREANNEESMRRVAGILYNRLSQGMRLQIDATLNYILNKTSAELTKDDLAMKSPYNSYRNEGLPPTPIANPGMQAINAVLNSLQSDDLFYLTGSDGKFYYAKTHEEHVRNKEKYLR